MSYCAHCIHTLAVIRVKCMYLEVTDIFSYSHLSIVDIFISLISLSDVYVFVYSTRVFNSTEYNNAQTSHATSPTPMPRPHDVRDELYVWWLHASENPSSIICVVSGHLCTFFYQNLLSGIAYSIMSNKTLPYHTIPYHC